MTTKEIILETAIASESFLKKDSILSILSIVLEVAFWIWYSLDEEKVSEVMPVKNIPKYLRRG